MPRKAPWLPCHRFGFRGKPLMINSSRLFNLCFRSGFFSSVYFHSETILEAQQVKTWKKYLDKICCKLVDLCHMSKSIGDVTKGCNSSFVFKVWEYCLHLGEYWENIVHIADVEHLDIRSSERISISLSFLTDYHYRYITYNFRISFLSMPIWHNTSSINTAQTTQHTVRERTWSKLRKCILWLLGLQLSEGSLPDSYIGSVADWLLRGDVDRKSVV